MPFVLILLAMIISNYILSNLIVGTTKKEFPENVKKINLFARIIIGIIAIISFLLINMNYGAESEAMKWFWVIFITVLFGFQSYIDWKYLKDRKQTIVSVILLFIGIGTANLLYIIY
ncbi:DUF4181 domain-containing protein [Ornithinibacillus salinisoli]|uniref:DUF4181 domain-containing protein n=2 Tax=Ornithinibacillus salinisoli TaxID=1848459 RepID=A0ABW4W2L7_9BACI